MGDNSNSVLDLVGFWKGVPICNVCRSSFDPKKASQHFKRHCFNSKQCQDISELVQKYSRTSDEKEDSILKLYTDPSPGHEEEALDPVPGLREVLAKRCPICRKLFKVTSSRIHLLKAHSEDPQISIAKEELKKTPTVVAQTLFGNNQTRYFQIKTKASLSKNETPENSSFFEDIIKSRRQKHVPHRDSIALNDKAKSALADELGLHNFMKAHSLTPEEAIEITTLPDTNAMARLSSLIVRYYTHFREMKPPVPVHIRDMVRIKGSKFNLYIEPDTISLYARHLRRFIISIANLFDNEKNRTISVPEKVGKSASDVLKLCLEETSSVSFEDLAKLHLLSKLLLLEEVWSSGGERCVIEDVFYLIACGFDKSQSERVRMCDADDATHIFAALQHVLHICAIGEFLERPIAFGPRRGSRNDNDAREYIRSATCTNSSTPAAYIRYMLCRSFTISESEVPRLQFICFKERGTVGGTIGSNRISLNDDRPGSLRYVILSLQDRSRKLLSEMLRGFRLPDDFYHNVGNFQDNITEKSAGYYFGCHPANVELVETWQAQFLCHVCSGAKPLLRIEKKNAEDEPFLTITKSAEKWLQLSGELAKLLFTIMVLVGGGPPRCSEFSSIRIRNTICGRRNLFLENGMLSTIITYSKVQKIKGPRPVARCFDKATCEVLFQQILLIIPVEAVVLEKTFGTARACEDFLFTRKGDVISEVTAAKAFSENCFAHGVSLNMRLYRQFQVGAAKAFIPHYRNGPQSHGVEHLQSGHSVRTAFSHYASLENQFDNMTSAEFDSFREASIDWHKLLGIENGTVGEVPRKPPSVTNETCHVPKSLQLLDNVRLRNIENDVRNILTSMKAESVTSRDRKSIELDDGEYGPESKKGKYVLPDPVYYLRLFLGSTAKFKSDGQELLVRNELNVLFSPQKKTTTIAILPTGGGKSLGWMLPAFVSQHISSSGPLITVVVVPLTSLKEDLLRRCSESGIHAVRWNDRNSHGVSVIIVDVTTVNNSGSEYTEFIRTISVQYRLSMIVIDEAHLLVGWRDFRDFSRIAATIRPTMVNCHLLCLTATAPDLLIPRILQATNADDTLLTTIRIPTRRSNISYSIVWCPDQEEGKLFELFLSKIVEEFELLSNRGLLIVYCLTRRDIEIIVSLTKSETRLCGINVCVFYGSLRNEERREHMAKWTNNKSIMFATTALGCGLDIKNVRTVIHVGGSWSLLDFIQESGRAGRDNVPSRSVVLYNRRFLLKRTSRKDIPDRDSSKATNIAELFGSFVRWAETQSCRRTGLDNFCDGTSKGLCSSEDELCDFCSGMDYRVENSGLSNGILQIHQNVSQPRPSQLGVSQADPITSFTGESFSDVTGLRPLLEILNVFDCAICLFNRGKVSLQNTRHESCWNKRCYKCLRYPAIGHDYRTCDAIPSRIQHNRCFVCGISSGYNVHTMSEFGRAGSCPWQIIKNLCALIWYNPQERRALVNAIHGNDVFKDVTTIKGFLRELCKGEDPVIDGPCLIFKAVPYLHKRFYTDK